MPTAFQRLACLGDLEPHQWPIDDWRRRGLRPIGYLCSYVPEEVLFAAGLHPVRVMGTPQEGALRADIYVTGNCCGFCRCVLNAALEGTYDFLEGIVTTESCENMRRVYDLWSHHVGGNRFYYILSLPRHVGLPSAVLRYASEIRGLQGALEEHYQTAIEPESLVEAIRIYNTTRRLFHRLSSSLSAGSRRGIGSADLLRIEKAGMWMPRVEFNELLEAAIREIEVTPATEELDGAKRILVSGSILASPEFFESIEETGARIVAEDLCTGTRYFSGLAEEAGDPTMALSARYLNKVPCPRMFGNDRRLGYILYLVNRFDVDAVILSPLKYCDPHSYTAPIIEARLQELGIPVLRLDRDYAPNAIGQMKVRVEAFMEMLSEEL